MSNGRASRRGLLGGSFAGNVLFICLFLPSYQSCGSHITPWELPPIYPPYVFGFLVTGACMVAASPRTGPNSGWLWPAIIAGYLCYIASGVVLGLAVLNQQRNAGWFFILLILPWIAAIRPAFRGLNSNRNLRWRLGRSTWLGGLASTLWFTLWTVGGSFLDSGDDHAVYGAWVSLAASVGLIIAGASIERSALQEHEIEPEIAKVVILSE